MMTREVRDMDRIMAASVLLNAVEGMGKAQMVDDSLAQYDRLAAGIWLKAIAGLPLREHLDEDEMRRRIKDISSTLIAFYKNSERHQFVVEVTVRPK